MSSKGTYYIVHPNGDVYDELDNGYTYDGHYLFDLDGKKHEIKENDLIGVFAECSTPNKKIVFQNFSLSFDVNVSARISRVANHEAHILPLAHSNSSGKHLPDDFIEFVELATYKNVIVGEEGKICPEVGYDIIPHIEVKIKNEEKNLHPIRKTEKELKLAPLMDDKFIKSLEEHFADVASHFENELKIEINKLINHLFYEPHIKTRGNETRKAFIAEMLKAKEKDVRRRIPAQKGRTPINQQKDFLTEKEKFINQCFKAFDELKAKKRKLNRTELAEILFNDSNPMQTLRRRFKSLDLTFENVLRQYTEQKPS